MQRAVTIAYLLAACSKLHRLSSRHAVLLPFWGTITRVIEVGLHLSKWFGDAIIWFSVFLKVQQTSFRASCTRLSPPFKSSLAYWIFHKCTGLSHINPYIIHLPRRLVGSNMSCPGNYEYEQCDFNGIKGVLPYTISRLLNLGSL